MNCAIRTQNLSKEFRRVVALADMDVEVPEGAIYALVGPNGAGKTTTLKTLMNIWRPTRGRAEVLGVNSTRLAPRELARIGYVSENQEMPEWMTVEYLFGYLKPLYPKWDDKLCADLVRRFDLPVRRKIRHLSRGMRMKAACASSFSYSPELVILDEPFTGLDALVRDELIEGLLERSHGATVLISSHDLAEIESFASHVGYLEQGHLQFSEEMASLVERFREVEVTFEAPPAIPAVWPGGWMQPDAAGAVFRFVDSRFERERTTSEIRRIFGDVRDISFSPMPLRAIFVALAKNTRAIA